MEVRPESSENYLNKPMLLEMGDFVVLVEDMLLQPSSDGFLLGDAVQHVRDFMLSAPGNGPG